MNTKIASSYIPYAWEVAEGLTRTNRHISLVFIGKQLVATGTNERKTHPLAIKYQYLYPDVHSELSAFVKCKHLGYQNPLSLVNYHFNRQGVLKMARPCKRCFIWTIHAFDEIWYSVPDGFIKMNY